MFEDFFTFYNQVKPPSGFEGTKSFDIPEIKASSTDFNLYQSSDTENNDFLDSYNVEDSFEDGQPTNDYFRFVYPEVQPTNQYIQRKEKEQDTQNDLIKLDIEDLLKQEGLTSINGKPIKFGSKKLRSSNASYGSKNSHHKRVDPYTGNASARDISIVGGTDKDYADFRAALLSNKRIRQYMTLKGWGIINELSPQIMKKTGATGRHFHFGPDQWAQRTWNTWISNPNLNITQMV